MLNTSCNHWSRASWFVSTLVSTALTNRSDIVYNTFGALKLHMNRGEGCIGMIKLGHTATYMGDLYILELGYFSAET